MVKTRSIIGMLCGWLLSCVFLTGCSEAWMEDRAIARAREYLLENAPELSANQQAFVRYNQPVLLMENIYSGGQSAGSDMNQVCITWVIPGKQDAYLVFGAGDYRLESWYPARLIRKTFDNSQATLVRAADVARKYALDALYFDMTVHEYNCVRYELPSVYRTDFEIPDTDPDAEPEKKPESAKKPELVQFSLVWSPRAWKNKIAVIGTAKKDLTGFAVCGGMVISPEELGKHTVGLGLPPAEKQEETK